VANLREHGQAGYGQRYRSSHYSSQGLIHFITLSTRASARESAARKSAGGDKDTAFHAITLPLG
jgi:hypothetical protein